MARTREFDADATLQAAMDAFWEKGYEGTSIHDLVERTGVQRASLYAAFGNKRDLFLATVDLYCRSGFDLRPEEGLAGIGRILRAIADQTCSNARGCYLTNAAVECGPDDRDIQARLAPMLRKIEEVTLAALHTAQEAGEVPGGPLRPKARLVVNTILGLRVMARSTPDPAVLDDIVEVAMNALTA